MEQNFYTYEQIILGFRKEYLDICKKLEDLDEYITYKNILNKEYNFTICQKKEDSPVQLRIIAQYKGYLKKLYELIFRYKNIFLYLEKSNDNMYFVNQRNLTFFEKSNFKIKDNMIQEFSQKVDCLLNSNQVKQARVFEKINPLNKTCHCWSSRQKFYGFNCENDICSIDYFSPLFDKNEEIIIASITRIGEKFSSISEEEFYEVLKTPILKDSFTIEHQKVINQEIEQESHIVLSASYTPKSYCRFKIKEDEEKLILEPLKKS